VVQLLYPLLHGTVDAFSLFVVSEGTVIHYKASVFWKLLGFFSIEGYEYSIYSFEGVFLSF
jgi:hypothetical protein